MKIFYRLWLLVGLLAAVGCSVNPVTGKQELNLVSEQWELDTGKQQYLPMRQSQGGDYVADPEVQRYVDSVGQRLAAVSDRKLPYEFHVLNNSVPNAWALPGGKIAINRGLLTELKSEAELAAVLGHEIVHAAAKHGAQGMQRGLLLQGAVLGTAIVTQGEDYASLAQAGASVGAQLLNTKYGRDAERESDEYGMAYMSRAGYDPQGAVALQETFVNLSDGGQQNWLQGLFSSHPVSSERVENNRQIAARLPPGGERGETRFRQVMARLEQSRPAYKDYDDAQAAYKKEDFGTARTLLQRAIAREPNEGHFYSLLGDLDYTAGEFSRARRQFDKAIALNEAFFYYHLRRGLVNEKLDDAPAAQRDLERSAQLLPTAAASHALGNLARKAGDLDLAKNHYTEAARHPSDTGKQAYASLVRIDLPQNPQNYLQLRNSRDALGRWYIEIVNPTPSAVDGLRLELLFPDQGGQIRRDERVINGRVPAGETVRVYSGMTIKAQWSSRYRSTIIAADLAD